MNNVLSILMLGLLCPKSIMAQEESPINRAFEQIIVIFEKADKYFQVKGDLEKERRLGRKISYLLYAINDLQQAKQELIDSLTIGHVPNDINYLKKMMRDVQERLKDIELEADLTAGKDIQVAVKMLEYAGSVKDDQIQKISVLLSGQRNQLRWNPRTREPEFRLKSIVAEAERSAKIAQTLRSKASSLVKSYSSE
ncbi:MAG: hypothetical protein KDC99_18550 [Cyclobacteriaceae bacterium]|nr:hypothetical protein [Cyclobacteriaceae bacterium]